MKQPLLPTANRPWCSLGQLVCARHGAYPEGGVTTEHRLCLSCRGVLCPHEAPLAHLGCLPWCWAVASLPAAVPPLGCCALTRSSFVELLPPALVQGLLLSTSLCPASGFTLW